jgi:hypothetical protein
MVVAGHSAGVEGRRLRAQADEHRRVAAGLAEEAERWMLASRTERSVSGSLAALAPQGYRFLHDRGWPGSRGNAQIDHVLIGPGGLFIVDTKAWKEPLIASGRIFRGDSDVTDELSGLADVGRDAEAAMAEIGLAPGEVHVVVVLAGHSMPPVEIGSVVVVGEKRAALHINSRGQRLSDAEVDLVTKAAMEHFPVLRSGPTELDLTIRPAVVEESRPEPLLTVADVTEVFLAGALAEPIESWMAFLHPDQAKLVRRSFNGPSRIRGAAGTGKTVVGLHRAAYLARAQPKQVLVTSFVKTLPGVLSELMRRLAPHSAERVEFTGIHAFALRLLRERGIRPRLDSSAAGLAFSNAWRRFGLPGPLARIENEQYWRDEVGKVIKGRGLTTFDQYADLTRTGRRRPLNLDQRRAVWQLFVAYEQALRVAGVSDFDDVVLLAEASLRAHPLDRYGAVIIDEAQDLTCAMVRMLHLLVGDAPDGLTVIGDGQQSIYPGGFTLAEAGISIAGRGVIMSTNYRNTREIVAFASRTVEGDEFADIDGGVRPGDEVGEIARSGARPVLERFRSRREHDAALLSRLGNVGCARGDVGILCVTTRGVAEVMRALAAAGIPAVDLNDYAGVPVDAVKVGTVKRAKGLEFKSVLLPRVRPEWIDETARDDEAQVIHRRELYVAMTRARDELWVGVCT